MTPRPCALVLLVLLGAAGCSSSAASRAASGSPYHTPPEGARDTVKAQALNRQAAALLDNDPDTLAPTHQLLCDALTHDLFFGPAHNNLGIVHLRQGRLYEAAHEFEWAARLMPGHPDPRMNLALVMERAGRIDEAIAACDTALEAFPNHLPTLQALTGIQLRHRRADDRTGAMLQEIALRGSDPAWRDWARRQGALLDAVVPAPF
jgi:tetratricopeptide (TPR) repeat protein